MGTALIFISQHCRHHKSFWLFRWKAQSDLLPVAALFAYKRYRLDVNSCIWNASRLDTQTLSKGYHLWLLTDVRHHNFPIEPTAHWPRRSTVIKSNIYYYCATECHFKCSLCYKLNKLVTSLWALSVSIEQWPSLYNDFISEIKGTILFNYENFMYVLFFFLLQNLHVENRVIGLHRHHHPDHIWWNISR